MSTSLLAALLGQASLQERHSPLQIEPGQLVKQQM